MHVVGAGFAKLLLFGEHAAVFGHPALGVALPEKTTVSFHGEPARAWELNEIPPEDRLTVQRVLDRLEVLLPGLAENGRSAVRIRSAVPRGIGMGSSAALCAAFAEAASHSIQGRSASDLAQTWELAHELERLFHGTPSGIDTGLSLLNGLIAFSPRPPALPHWERMASVPIWLVVGALPRRGESSNLISGIGERMRAGEQTVRQALSGLGSIAAGAKQVLAESGSPGGIDPAPSIGRLADQAMEVLRGLGLSDPGLDWLLDEGRRSGALGGKLSGAGGGGAFFLVATDDGAARETAVRLSAAASGRGISFAATPSVLCIGHRR